MISFPSGSIGMIPARLNSERFPNKILQNIDGIPILERVILNVLQSEIMDKIVVTTDSEEIVKFCKNLGVEFIFMNEEVSCGSERIIKVYQTYPNYQNYVSFPADEPMLNPIALKNMWKKHLSLSTNYNEVIRTCWSKFYDKNRISLNRTCKIVSNNDNVLYFSRAPIPYSKNGLLPIEEYKKHVGIFIFDNMFFQYDNIKPWNGELSKKESLEQLAFLENGFKIRLLEIDHPYHGVDCPEDIENIEKLIRSKK